VSVSESHAERDSNSKTDNASESAVLVLTPSPTVNVSKLVAPWASSSEMVPAPRSSVLMASS
jgi:hypothetical protein